MLKPQTKKLHSAVIQIKDNLRILKKCYLSFDKLANDYKVSFVNPDLMGERYEKLFKYELINGKIKVI